MMELTNITTDCKNQTIKDSCITDLKETIDDAERMNISERELEEFKNAMQEFQVSETEYSCNIAR